MPDAGAATSTRRSASPCRARRSARPRTCRAASSCSVAGLPQLVEVLPPAAASALCGDPGVVIADARPARRFAEGHIADAIHLPCAATGAAASDALARLVGKHTVVVYGDSTAEARSVAESLQAHGARDHLRVVVLDGGFGAWSEAGLACSSGPCPECADKGAPSSHEHMEARAP